MTTDSHLVINFVCMHPNLSGGYKAARLLAEALFRRGHRVHLLYLCDSQWPPITQPLRLLRHLHGLWQGRGHSAHHFESSSATLVPIQGFRVRATDAPDADASIGIMWETREWIEDWPSSKGIKVFMVQGDERLRDGEVLRIEAVHRLPGLLLTVSSWAQQFLKKQYKLHSVILMPNGVEDSLLDAPIRNRGNPPTVGLMYGRSELKGAAVAFEAIRIAQRRLAKLRTIAFGAAPIHRRHRPPTPFEFYMRPPQEMLPSIYQRADCWLLPSTSEGFGMPGLEAAACRCPVIATRCGGPADYVREAMSGYLVDVGDTVAMADRIVEILTCDAGRWRTMSDCSHQIASQFTWDRSASILEQAILGQREQSRLAEGEPSQRRYSGGPSA